MTEAFISTAHTAHPDVFVPFGSIADHGDPIHMTGPHIDIYHLGSPERGAIEVIQNNDHTGYGHTENILGRVLPQKTQTFTVGDTLIKVEHT